MKAMTLDTQLSFMHGDGYEFVCAWFHILHSSVCISIIHRSPFPLLIFPSVSVTVQKGPGTSRQTAANKLTRRCQRGPIGEQRRERGTTARTTRVEGKGREGQTGGEPGSLAGSPKPGGPPQASLARSPAPSPDRRRHPIAQAPLARKPRPQARQPEPSRRRAPSPPEPQTGAKTPDIEQGSHGR